MQRVLLSLWVTFSLACGAAQPQSEGPIDLPTLQGRPVYSTSLQMAPPSVATIWPEVEEALASEVDDDWARRRAQLIQRLDPEWGRLDQGSADDMLFSAVTRGMLLDDFATRLTSQGETQPRAAEAARDARRAYAVCVRQAPSASELLRDWGGTCLERSAALEPLTGD